MKTPYKSVNSHFLKLLLCTGMLFMSGCDYVANSHGPSPNVTGVWSGGFNGQNAITYGITINISSQYQDLNNPDKDILDGTWSSNDAGFSNDFISGTLTDAYISGDYMHIYIDIPTGNACYYRIDISDYVRTNLSTGEVESLIDSGSVFDRNCTRTVGTMEMTRNPPAAP